MEKNTSIVMLKLGKTNTSRWVNDGIYTSHDAVHDELYVQALTDPEDVVSLEVRRRRKKRKERKRANTMQSGYSLHDCDIGSQWCYLYWSGSEGEIK